MRMSHPIQIIQTNACLLSSDSEERPSSWQQCPEVMLRTPRATRPQPGSEAGRDEGCQCSVQKQVLSFCPDAPHRIWARSHP